MPRHVVYSGQPLTVRRVELDPRSPKRHASDVYFRTIAKDSKTDVNPTYSATTGLKIAQAHMERLTARGTYCHPPNGGAPYWTNWLENFNVDYAMQRLGAAWTTNDVLFGGTNLTDKIYNPNFEDRSNGEVIIPRMARRWLPVSIANFFDRRVYFQPLCVDSHFSLFVVVNIHVLHPSYKGDRHALKLYHLDSYSSHATLKFARCIKTLLRERWIHEFGAAPGQAKPKELAEIDKVLGFNAGRCSTPANGVFRIPMCDRHPAHANGSLIQGNLYDCGMYTIEFVRRILARPELATQRPTAASLIGMVERALYRDPNAEALQPAFTQRDVTRARQDELAHYLREHEAYLQTSTPIDLVDHEESPTADVDVGNRTYDRRGAMPSTPDDYALPPWVRSDCTSEEEEEEDYDADDRTMSDVEGKRAFIDDSAAIARSKRRYSSDDDDEDEDEEDDEDGELESHESFEAVQ